MIRHLSILILTVISLISLQANADSDCGRDYVKLKPVYHVYLLPPDVLDILHQSTGPRIADVDEPYDVGDVRTGLPRTKFLRGYVSDDCVVADLVYGGYAVIQKMVVFQKTDQGWQQINKDWHETKLRPEVLVYPHLKQP